MEAAALSSRWGVNPPIFAEFWAIHNRRFGLGPRYRSGVLLVSLRSSLRWFRGVVPHN